MIACSQRSKTVAGYVDPTARLVYNKKQYMRSCCVTLLLLNKTCTIRTNICRGSSQHSLSWTSLLSYSTFSTSTCPCTSSAAPMKTLKVSVDSLFTIKYNCYKIRLIPTLIPKFLELPMSMWMRYCCEKIHHHHTSIQQLVCCIKRSSTCDLVVLLCSY